MPRFRDFEPKGVIPATLLAFNEDFSIDEASTRKHLLDVCGVEGISAVAINAHASEVHACTFEEQVRILDMTMDFFAMIGGRGRSRAQPPAQQHGADRAPPALRVCAGTWYERAHLPPNGARR